MGDKRFVPDLKFVFVLGISFMLLNLLSWSSGLEFKTSDDRSSSSSSTRNMKLQLRKKTLATSALTPHGLVIDRPKIQVVSYRVKSTDPWVIQDDLNCVDGYCDELVESLGKTRGDGGHEKGHLKLGQGDGEVSEWSVPPNVTQILLECHSKAGPVEWDYEGRGSIPNIEIENTRLTGDFWTLTSYTHVSQLVVRKIGDQLTGVYSCRNVDKPLVTNSFNMFVPQENLQILEDGRLIKIMPPSNSAEVIIPCRQSDRDTSIYLFKKFKDGSLRKVNMNNGIRFDPYVGFYLRITRETFGRYICKIDKSNQSSRKRREAFQKSEVVQTSTSPGIQAFPTSEELLDQLMVEDSTADRSRYSVSLPPFPISDIIVGQSPVARQELLLPPLPVNFETPPNPDIAFGPLGKPTKVKRRRKNPLMRRQGTPGHTGLLRRRGGPPGPVYHGPRHPGPPFRPRRPGGPGLFMNFRRHPSTNHPHYNGPHPIPQGSSYSSQGQGPFTPEGVDPSGYFGPSPIPYPPPVLPAKVLPTFLNKGGNRIKPFASSEEHSSETKHEEEMTMIDLSSRVDSKLGNSSKRYKPPKRGAAVLLSPNLPSQTMKIMSSMHCVLKKVMLGPNATCDGTLFDSSSISQRPVGSPGGIVGGSTEQKTILEVDVVPAPENKFFPNSTVLYTTVPFFVKWQTRFTDYADWADVNHTLKDGTFKRHKSGGFENGVNTFEVFNLQEGEFGKITVEYMGRNKEIHHHTWKFFVINSTVNEAKGLKHEEIGRMQTFTCRASSSNKPYIRLTYLSEEGCPLKDLSDGDDDSKRSMKNLRKDEIVEDCGPGCSLIKSELEFGLVHCIGDGVDEKIRFPQDLHCTGRPYFVQRGTSKNMTFEADQKQMVFPCLINNPTADVFLFHQDLNGTVVEVTDFATYELKTGFSLDLAKVKDPNGTYICTSSTDLHDETDIVTYNVVPASDFKFVPEQEDVFGAPPFKFMWEAREELELDNKSAGSFYSGIFANPEGSRPNVGTFEITSLPEGQSGEIRVLRSSDKTVMHVWRYKHTVKPRLWLDKKRNVFRCQATSENVPTLIAVECSSSNACNLKSRFLEGEKSGRDNSECGRGCAQLKVWGNKPTGFVKCEGDGIDEKLHYFLSNNSTLVTERDDLEPLRTPEITNAVKQLRIGESTNFKCSASKYFYSKGFQWAIETRTGSKRFVDLKIKDDDYFLNEVRSEIRLKVMDQDWKAVWCFAPVIDSNLWRNASQPIYIKL